MPLHPICAGALSQLLLLDETGCPHSARHSVRLLDHLADTPELDADLRALCERASRRLVQRYALDDVRAR